MRSFSAQHRIPFRDSINYGRRKIVEFNLPSSGDNYGALDRILEFTYVAGPLIAGQRAQCISGDSLNKPSRALFVVLEKMDHQQVNIFGTIAESGKLNRKD